MEGNRASGTAGRPSVSAVSAVAPSIGFTPPAGRTAGALPGPYYSPSRGLSLVSNNGPIHLAEKISQNTVLTELL